MSVRSTQAILKRATEVCAERGARLTEQRARVLGIVIDAKGPLTAYDILDRLQEDGKRAAPPTVYRALDFLLEQGLLHKLQSLHAFVHCHHPEEPHHSQFFICADCGDVDEVESARVAESLASAEAERGFTADRAMVEVVGTCADCSKR